MIFKGSDASYNNKNNTARKISPLQSPKVVSHISNRPSCDGASRRRTTTACIPATTHALCILVRSSLAYERDSGTAPLHISYMTVLWEGNQVPELGFQQEERKY